MNLTLPANCTSRCACTHDDLIPSLHGGGRKQSIVIKTQEDTYHDCRVQNKVLDKLGDAIKSCH